MDSRNVCLDLNEMEMAVVLDAINNMEIKLREVRSKIVIYELQSAKQKILAAQGRDHG